MPDEHSTSARTTSGSSVGATVKRWMVTGRGWRSTSMPSRASSWRRLPSIFTAETIGGTCMMSPVRPTAAASTAAKVVPAMSWVAVTSPESSRVEVSVPSTMSQV